MLFGTQDQVQPYLTDINYMKLLNASRVVFLQQLVRLLSNLCSVYIRGKFNIIPIPNLEVLHLTEL